MTREVDLFLKDGVLNLYDEIASDFSGDLYMRSIASYFFEPWARCCCRIIAEDVAVLVIIPEVYKCRRLSR